VTVTELVAWAADRQADYAAHRRDWAEAIGRRDAPPPLADPGPLTVDEFAE
jgi:hypothetical protein